jgi:Zn-dependent protease
MGSSATLLFFVSLLLHELGHSLISQRCGIPVTRITLLFIGGVAEISREPDDAKSELKIALGGPAVSVGLAMMFLGGWGLCLVAKLEAASAVCLLLCVSNVLLVAFNMIPGYPLDGGRVLRAILWRSSGNIQDATRKAGICGILIGAVLILFGTYIMIAPNWRPSEPYFMGGWSILVGLFLLDTAAKVVKGSREARLLTVADGMSSPIAIDPRLTISRFVDDVLPLHRQTQDTSGGPAIMSNQPQGKWLWNC